MRISDWSSDVCSSDLFLVNPRVDVLRGDGQAIFALQAFVQRFNGLHCLGLVLAQNLVTSRPARADWCGRRDSNPHILRYWYLKPARLPIPPRPLRAVGRVHKVMR